MSQQNYEQYYFEQARDAVAGCKMSEKEADHRFDIGGHVFDLCMKPICNSILRTILAEKVRKKYDEIMCMPKTERERIYGIPPGGPKKNTSEESQQAEEFRHREQAREDAWRENHQQSERKHQQASRNQDEEQHCKTLGIDGLITPDAVKRQYRILASQYHPDKVAHLGPKLKVAAEEEMKKINVAFRYYKDKYKMERE